MYWQNDQLSRLQVTLVPYDSRLALEIFGVHSLPDITMTGWPFKIVLMCDTSPSDVEQCETLDEREIEASKTHIFAIIGASGDLAKRKLYPSLWRLYVNKLLPEKTIIIGYARSELTLEHLKERTQSYIKVKRGQKRRFRDFWKMNHYIKGSYDALEDFGFLNKQMIKLGTRQANRIFYLALPPSVFQVVTARIKECCMATQGWTRIIIEKPFGKDSESSANLSQHLEKLFTGEEIYRIDHYLGKEMVQNILQFR